MPMTAEELLAEYQAGRLTLEEYQNALAAAIAAGATVDDDDDDQAPEPEPAPDTTAPVVTLIGDTSITIEKGTTYVEQGATASDHDGSASVTITGDVDGF